MSRKKEGRGKIKASFGSCSLGFLWIKNTQNEDIKKKESQKVFIKPIEIILLPKFGGV